MKKSFKLFLVALCAVFACLAFTGCPSPTTTPEPSTPVTPEPSAPVTPEPPVTYIGTKTPTETKAVGDIVFTDGSASPYTEELTNEQKAAAIAVIFYVGDENDTLGAKTLGVGLDISVETRWCEDRLFYQDKEHVTSMTDGKRNTDEIKERIDWTEEWAEENFKYCYPAFYFCVNYNVKGFTSGWYLPAKEEVQKRYDNREPLYTVLTMLGKENPFESDLTWSSTNDVDYYGAWALNFKDTGIGKGSCYWYRGCYANYPYNVCAIHTF